VVSWSSVDALGRWKALQYEAARVFAPVAVLADRWADTLAVWVASDTEASGVLEVRVLDFDGNELARREAPLASAGLAWRGTRGELVPDTVDPRSVVVLASLRGATDAAFLVAPKELALPDPGLRVVSVERDGDAWRVALAADRFAFGAHLSVDGVGARFSTNDVHLLPGDTVRIRVTPDTPIADLGSRLRLRSLADGSRRWGRTQRAR
jgi:beta-mannosidase